MIAVLKVLRVHRKQPTIARGMDRIARFVVIHRSIEAGETLIQCAAGSMRRGVLTEQYLQFADAVFKRFNHFACAQQHAALYVEFIAGDKIELAQA